MKALTEYIAKSLVDHPDEVVVDEIRHGNRVTLELSVAKDDMGRNVGHISHTPSPFILSLRGCTREGDVLRRLQRGSRRLQHLSGCCENHGGNKVRPGRLSW